MNRQEIALKIHKIKKKRFQTLIHVAVVINKYSFKYTLFAADFIECEVKGNIFS